MKTTPTKAKAPRERGQGGKANTNQRANHNPPALFGQCDEALELKRSFLSELFEDFGGNSAENQRQRIVESLARFSLTTPEIRKYLDVMEVAARIWELRHVYGHGIDMSMVEDRTDLGRTHKVALYTLTKYVVRPDSEKNRAGV